MQTNKSIRVVVWMHLKFILRRLAIHVIQTSRRTRRLYEIEGIDDVRTTYSLKISQPQDESLPLDPLQHIRSTAWFTSIYEEVLDSIYFSNGSIIQCSARAVTTAGMGGYESISEIVTSVSMKPQCPSRGPSSSVTVDPFQASISNMSEWYSELGAKILSNIETIMVKIKPTA